MKTILRYLLLILFIIGCKKEKVVQPMVDYEISVGSSFKIELNSNRTTGYSWVWVNKQVVSIVDTFDYQYTIDEPVKIGSGGKEVWNFKGLRIGTDTIKLNYMRSWDTTSVADSKSFVVRVI